MYDVFAFLAKTEETELVKTRSVRDPARRLAKWGPRNAACAFWGEEQQRSVRCFCVFGKNRGNGACKDAKRQGSRKAACALWERGGTMERREAF